MNNCAGLLPLTRDCFESKQDAQNEINKFKEKLLLTRSMYSETIKMIFEKGNIIECAYAGTGCFDSYGRYFVNDNGGDKYLVRFAYKNRPLNEVIMTF